ncbi:dehydrase and lipid transport-domain-containing protein [Chaetomidium leptoderma]|uniref:Dehydrase and lipid transport-domain-containing protein n=1 Tax=Chaetomidium leptoderma TaxID=669021 RepID=A0AAN6ZZF5_9PEZI|nr:dehydrase and lipid transport-domain-containing protein [Chaetomidium leptoderma]
MASRFPPTTRRLLAARAPLQSLSRSVTPLSRSPQPPLRLPSFLPQAQAQAQAHRALTTTTPRPWLLSALPNLASPNNNHPQPSKTLRARRLLPYPPEKIYTLIADIDAYQHFLPHCAHSRVTRWTSLSSSPEEGSGSEPAKSQHRTRHPAQADLTVGWGPFTQTYTSRVYCVPGQAVEAVSGAAAVTTISAEVLRSVGYDVVVEDDGGGIKKGGGGGEKMEGIFESLVTRWTVKPAPSPAASATSASAAQEKRGGGWTEVSLSVTFQFANPALGFAVGQLADDKVSEMVEAFEARARELYGTR